MKKQILLFLTLTNIGLVSAQWQQTSYPISQLDGIVTSMAVNGTTVYAGDLDGNFYFTNDSGTTWTQANNGISGLGIHAIAFNGSDIFVGVNDGITDGGVYLSNNNGSSWSGVNNGLSGSAIYSLAVKGSDVFAGNQSYGMYVSANDGSNWTATNSGFPNANVNTLLVDGTDIFAGTSYHGIYLSTNNGATWRAINNGLRDTTGSVYALVSSGINIFAGTDSGVFLSTNNGASWAATGLANSAVYSLAVSGTIIFAGTDNNEVYASVNNGTDWTTFNDGLTLSYNEIPSMAISGSDVYIGTEFGGIWKRPIAETVGIEEFSENKIAVYPNPVSGIINISLNKNISNGEINIFNTMGEMVYEEQFNGTQKTINLKSAEGIYFVRVSDGNETWTSKIVSE